MKRIFFILSTLAFAICAGAQKLFIQKNNSSVESYNFYQSTSKITFDADNYRVYIGNELHVYPASEVTFIYFEKQEPTRGTVNGHEWVDLGLPSGTRWATCNIGASSPTDYGDLYAWGETKTKSWFGSGNYDHYGSYIISNDIAYSDNDVATKKWGGRWRMPTFTQICELAKKCSFRWTTISGINGTIFTGPNGNSIFIPAGGGQGPGFKNGTDYVSFRGERGFYWSSTLYYRNNGNSAKSLYFDSNGVKLTTTSVFGEVMDEYTQCFNGLLVRPVIK